MVVGVQLVVISEEEEEHQLNMEMMMLENDDVLMETRLQSQTKSGLIKLESFKFLRVLLVEFDDSTRSIIAALLRKSGYRVVAVADGFKAWETLQARSHNIDLVLAEVQLPSPLSGFSLLTRIMADDFCRNIPVIMMSSYDAVNVVFKCMLGGAADFLVKPVRKNELRNLWQHVWRRHSATAAEAERSLPVANPPSQQITEAIDDETSSSEHHSTHSVSPTTTTTPNQTKDCTQKGRLSHSSCRKPDMKDDIMHIEAMHNLSQLKSRNVSLMKTKEAEPVHLDDVLLMNENEVEDKSVRLATEAAPCNQSSHSIALISDEQHADAGIMTRSNNPVTEALREDSNRHTDKYYTQDEQFRPSTEAMDLIGSFDNQLHEYNTRFEEVVPNTTSRNCSSTPRLELSLRRSHSSDSEIQGAVETQTLRHSNASAFSRYNHRTVQPPVCSERKEHVSVSCKHESDHALSQTAEVVPKRGVISVPLPVRSTRVDGLYSGCGAAVWPQLFYAPVGPLQLQSSNSVPQQEAVFHVYSSDESNPENYDLEQSNCKSSNTTVYKQQSNVEFLDDSKHVLVATQSVDSSLCNSSSSDINSSGCGSVCDGSNGNETAVTNVGGSSGRGNDVGVIMYDGIRGTDSHCSTQREAALTKFRLKRKDRCFDKKVRYQSRKRLAEQRPRVKGQFVRQISS